MVGRTPEYLGKKIEAFEMQMATVAILGPCLAVLVGAGIATALPAGRAGIANPGIHGFSEILYAFSSAGNNNGSAFAGLSANTPFYNLTLGIKKEEAWFLRLHVENYRTWYNDDGGFYPPTGFQYSQSDEARTLDRGEFSLEGGYKFKSNTGLNFKYSHELQLLKNLGPRDFNGSLRTRRAMAYAHRCL
jgi:hypothetical protein